MNGTSTDRPPRADAQRNREAILDAALSCLTVSPRASMAEIAQAAGVGRVTLYGHFSSRTELIEAAAARTMERAETQLTPLDLTGDPRQALALLIGASWRLVDDSRGIIAAAEGELGADRIRDHHDQTLLRVRRLIERGQAIGQFRRDLPVDWLTACYFSIMHGAGAELRSGRLTEAQVAEILPATILGLLSRPGERMPPAE